MITNYNDLQKMEKKIESLMKNKNSLVINDEIVIKKEKRDYLKNEVTENIIKYVACGQWEEYSMLSGSITNLVFETIMNYNDDKKIIKVTTNKYEGISEKKIKKLRTVELQLLNDLQKNGYIEVEKSNINENVYYYYKRLKNNKKSSITVYLLKNEIEIIEDKNNISTQEEQSNLDKLKNEVEKVGYKVGNYLSKNVINNIVFIDELLNKIVLLNTSDTVINIKDRFGIISAYVMEIQVFEDEKEICFYISTGEEYISKYGCEILTTKEVNHE